jgi:hypothetical protein
VKGIPGDVEEYMTDIVDEEYEDVDLSTARIIWSIER